MSYHPNKLDKNLSMEIGIVDIGTYIPDTLISNLDRLEEFEVTEDFINKKLGVTAVSKKSSQEDTADLAYCAWQDVAHSIDKDKIDCLVVCTQNPHANGIPHTSAVLHGMIGLSDHCACFDISLGCSGYVYGLSVVKAFMQANGMQCGMLVTADPYSKTIDPADRNTAMLFGDAATVTILGRQSKLVPYQFTFGTAGSGGEALNNNNGSLVMNGRAVFGFCSSRVPVQVTQLLQDAGLETNDIDLFLFHQGSRFIVEKLAQKLGIPSSKVPINLSEQGNTVSSSIPLLLKKYLHDYSQKTLLLSGFGVGLSWASCLATRKREI
ncbi:MAG: 3-oxoacyl-[acyl-carrier-protein] synthase-3 [Granulosicoccus sp.]|jgi:3-oxoacyl-[acyl-carrier-protein] synthase-3